MKKIYDIDNTIFRRNYKRAFFKYCLFHQPSLIKYVCIHIFYSLAYTFRFISKVDYAKAYWSFLKDIDANASFEGFAQNEELAITKDIDNEGIFIAYAPKVFIQYFLPTLDVVCLEDMPNEKDGLFQYLQQQNITNYETVGICDESLNEHAEKVYEMKKGKLVEKKDKLTSRSYKYLVGTLVLLSLLITISVLALTPNDATSIIYLICNPVIFLLNFIPVFFVLLILYGIFNSISLSFGFTFTIFVILVEINRFKIAFRDDAFIFRDIIYANEALQMTNNYKLYIDAMTLIVICMFLLIILYLYKRKVRKKSSIRVRLALCILPILCTPFLYREVYLNSSLYDQQWNAAFGNQWNTTNQFVARGFNYSFIRSYASAKPSAPDDYDEQSAIDKLNTYEEIDMKQSQKVNVISIMLEAYNDFDVLSDTAEIDSSVYQNMHEIRDNSYHGYVYTDIFAGGTIASERAFLSGYSSLGEFRTFTDSYVNYFNQQGYYTEAMHPCYGWFYNRRNVNDIGFGFNNFDYQENKYGEMIDNGEFDKTFAGFLTDDDFFDQIILGYENNKERNMPYFNFSVTYQNHGPYDDIANSDEQYLVWQDTYDESTYNIVNNYLTNIKATDEAIGKLYSYINEQDEPIILMMYGDHNPYLGEGNVGFEMLDIDLDLGTVEGGQNYYQTPYIITANEAAKQSLNSDFKGNGDTISPMFLMNELFEAANLNIGSSYSQYLKDLKQTIDVINPTYIKKDNIFTLRDKSKTDEVLEEFYDIQYYEQYVADVKN